MGDLYVKVRSPRAFIWKTWRNKNGKLLIDECDTEKLIIFPHKPRHKATWIFPKIITEDQIDHNWRVDELRAALRSVPITILLSQPSE